MAIKTGQVLATASAQKLDRTRATPTYWLLKALSGNATTVYYGDSAVTTSSGYLLEPGA
jgi:hypothetical protein